MQRFIINRTNLISFTLMIVYRLFLDAVYFSVVSKRFGYGGLIDRRTKAYGVVSWIILIGVYCIIRKILVHKESRSSYIIISILFYASFIPFTTCIYAGLFQTGYIVYNLVYWIMLIVGVKLFEKLPYKPFSMIRLNRRKVSKTLMITAGMLSLLLVLYISWRYAHFRLNFDLMKVYDIRLEAREYNYPRIVSYLFSWALAVNPVLFGLCLVKRKWGMAFLFFFIQMLSFGIDGLKSTFFMPLIVILVVFLYRKNDVTKLKIIIYACFCVLVILGFIEPFIMKTSNLADMGVRRMLFVPNQLGGYYYEFFTNNPPDYFRSSFLRFFGIQSPYTLNGIKGYTYTIGSVFFGRTTMNCNNGLSSDAIANFGIIGCVVMPILFAYVLHLFDRSTIRVNSKILITPVIYLSYNLLSTTLTTVLLTHGTFLIMLLMAIIGSIESEDNVVSNSDNNEVPNIEVKKNQTIRRKRKNEFI